MSRKKLTVDQTFRADPQSSPALRERLFRMVSVGVVGEPVNQFYDIISTGAVVINLIVSILATFDNLQLRWGTVFAFTEHLTVAFFAVDYILRLLTAKYLYPRSGEGRAVISYICSGSGIVDLLSFLPYYLPVFFPSGTAVFRLFRVARILRLFRINAYYDSLNVITEVLYSKKQQLLSSVFIILVLMVASSLCMYSLEHAAQPEIFRNAFSGIWWSVSTLLTVGYGDIYPVTVLGKAFGTVIAFLGVGMVAIPTGIISAGFVEQYTRLKRLEDYGEEMDSQFIRIVLKEKDTWNGKEIRQLGLPDHMIIAAVIRGTETMIPRPDITLLANDRILIAAEALDYERPVHLQELLLRRGHPWNGAAIRDLDISRQTLIVLVKRHGSSLVPRGSLILQEDDLVYLYTKVNETKTKAMNSNE